MPDAVLVYVVSVTTLMAAHQLGDHVLQSDRQAAHKADPGLTGWSCMALHVGIYHVIATVMLLVAFVGLGLGTPVRGLIAGLAFSAVTHAFLDRRWPVRLILTRMGSPTFAVMQSPVNGMYVADQALHYACLWISAILIARL